MGSLVGKVAVITGSSRGLGYAIAETYAREGAAVVLSARGASTLDEAVKALAAKGYRVSGFTCDVGSLDQVRALADHAVKTFGRLDIWVNNAGVAGVFGPTVSIPVDRFERVVQTNILGTYYGSITALGYFLPQRSGKLINLQGRGDDRAVPFQNAYGPSKTWIRSFTKALAQEYADSGVGIYAFNPGLVDTDMLRQIDSIPGYEGRLKRFSTVIQMWANDPDVPAERALWLASSATDGKTGLEVQVLNRGVVFRGIGRLIASKLTRQPMRRDGTLNITLVPPNEP
ncbi:MAG TPA: SDR family oxidoreductase [Phototrophicaceae bacterium]|nr:SDR family oxidoreductase [Phototrophicaceae bacterium]